MLRPLIPFLLAAALAMPASAQVPGLGGAVGGVLQPPLEAAGQASENLTRGAVDTLRGARMDALQQLQRRNPDLIDRDREGAFVIRSEVVAIAPTPEALAAATARGFIVRETVDAEALGLRMVVLAAPEGLSTRRALDTLRRLDPSGAYDYNHLYSGSGETVSGSIPKQAVGSRSGGGGVRVGLIDSGIDTGHPAFANTRIEQRGFGGDALPGAHGTAIGSILGNAAPSAALYVADVYGGRPTGGGASAIVAALSWLVEQRAAVINISLVGPPNRALEAAIAAAIARGCVIVAAVGNDGPAAAPLYPASYQGVVGVTGVDGRNRALPEAGRGEQVDFAAPGSDFQAASLTGGYTRVRGTSYAAPIVAGALAQRLSNPDVRAAAAAQAALARDAQDLGEPGRDRTFGAGLIGVELRNTGPLARR